MHQEPISSSIMPTIFQVNPLSVQLKKFKEDFQDDGHKSQHGFMLGIIFVIFQSGSCPDTFCEVSN